MNPSLPTQQRREPFDFIPGRVLPILGLWSLAVTQPLLDAVASNGVYRLQNEIGWPELLTLLVVVSGLGFAAVMLDKAIVRASSQVNGVGRNSAVFCLTFLALLACLRPMLRIPILLRESVTWIIVLGTALPVAWLVARHWERVRLLHQWLSFFALGLVLFPLGFLLKVRSLDGVRQTEVLPAIIVENPVPVVVVVFDEFSGASLMDDSLDIDAARFPGFARLARSSTWYRRATTVHARTDQALPSILSGRLSVAGKLANRTNYPGNLFELIARSNVYDVAIFEPFTGLSENLADEMGSHGTFGQRLRGLFSVATSVYPRLLLPRDFPLPLPSIPSVWHGLKPQSPDLSDLRSGRIRYPWCLKRDASLDHFLHCLPSDNRPKFCFLHVCLPHYPWCYLPSGRRYERDSFENLEPPAALGDLGEDWPLSDAQVFRYQYRYLLQVGYVDRFVSRLQDELQELGTWDSSLVIVMADHGVSFRAGHSRRIPDGETLPDIMSVPLFIKYPGQQVGKIDDRNAEIVDVLPTIIDVLALPADDPRDGTSLLASHEAPRKSFLLDRGETIVEPNFPQLIKAVRHSRRIFGDSSSWNLPKAAVLHPEWIGKSSEEFRIEDLDLGTVETRLRLASEPQGPAPFIPCFFEGSFFSSETSQAAAHVALAVNGKVVDVSQTYPQELGRRGFQLLAPEPLMNTDDQRVELFLVHDPEEAWKRIATWNF